MPSKLILVVDDDADVRAMVKQALVAKGHEVIEAGDGLAASQIIDNHPRKPDLLICDVMMPSIDGFTLAKLIRTKKRLTMPIIFLTAKTNPLDVVKGIQAGARHYVTKPFSIKDLMAKVEKTLG